MSSVDRSQRTPLVLLFAALMAVLTTACVQRPVFPAEFKLGRVLHQTEKAHFLGPGGSNHSFAVYEIPQEAAAKIQAGGLSYLNSLPSVVEQKKNAAQPRVETITYSVVKCAVPGCPEEKDPKNRVTRTFTGPYWAPFADWHATPVPKEEKWLRSGRSTGGDWELGIESFYKSYQADTSAAAFIATLPPALSEQFHEAISTPGSFYAYGHYRDMCILVVSPKQGKAFYLFRD
jgi:hypothetical protein